MPCQLAPLAKKTRIKDFTLTCRAIIGVLIAGQCRIRHIESEVRRSDRALAETAALLVLSKKSQAIWGDREGD